MVAVINVQRGSAVGRERKALVTLSCEESVRSGGSWLVFLFFGFVGGGGFVKSSTVPPHAVLAAILSCRAYFHERAAVAAAVAGN